MKVVPCLVFTVEEIIANASKRVGNNIAAFCDEVKLLNEYCDIVAGIQTVIHSIEDKSLRKTVAETVIGQVGYSYYFIPEVEDGDCKLMPRCVIVYPDGAQFVVEFFA